MKIHLKPWFSNNPLCSLNGFPEGPSSPHGQGSKGPIPQATGVAPILPALYIGLPRKLSFNEKDSYAKNLKTMALTYFSHFINVKQELKHKEAHPSLPTTMPPPANRAGDLITHIDDSTAICSDSTAKLTCMLQRLFRPSLSGARFLSGFWVLYNLFPCFVSFYSPSPMSSF